MVRSFDLVGRQGIASFGHGRSGLPDRTKGLQACALAISYVVQPGGLDLLSRMDVPAVLTYRGFA